MVFTGGSIVVQLAFMDFQTYKSNLKNKQSLLVSNKS